jgi:hypothetical protein
MPRHGVRECVAQAGHHLEGGEVGVAEPAAHQPA